ncbi:DUF4954 family protein [Odoribacter sp. OttesenSCG-928-J03]|nr:DUF4954 family protein [Odoribacter sp. OttesenSCG-928-J03]MDL2330955.1 DUF4954 family protein [Odoribacter sp. OttesenSCG-928-A06]
MDDRKLTAGEIEVLERRKCFADHWDNVSVREGFSPDSLYHVRFSGKISLGAMTKEYVFPGGVRCTAGIRNATIHNCELGDHVLIENVHGYLANYIVGDEVVIRNSGTIYVDGETTFGNGIAVPVLNEAGGREVLIHDQLSAHMAYISCHYRHRPLLIEHLQNMVEAYVAGKKSNVGRIDNHVSIIDTKTIRNVNIGTACQIEGASSLDNGTINSNEYDPVHIGNNVIIKDFIVCSGAHVEQGVLLNRCFVGQATHLGNAYTAVDSLFFCNSHAENGEACAVFAGPYTVTHHKSTLLIAGMFSFMNAGSGSNQSNHMYKLGPVHQGIVERGTKLASDSYIMWPARIGAFSFVTGRHYQNPDTSDMPFSYLIGSNDETYLVPAVNLRTIGTVRDEQKFPKRDKRKDPVKSECINFNTFSPYTMQKVFKAVEILNNLSKQSTEEGTIYDYQGCRIKDSSLKKGVSLYELAIDKYLGDVLNNRLKEWDGECTEELRMYLRPDSESGLGEWRDLSGIYLPGQVLEQFISDIENGTLKDVVAVNSFFTDTHCNYRSSEWTWVWDKIQSRYGLSLETVTRKDIAPVMEKCTHATECLNKMIAEDIQKEFSPAAHIGYGIDGGEKEREEDFRQVRGTI